MARGVLSLSRMCYITGEIERFWGRNSDKYKRRMIYIVRGDCSPRIHLPFKTIQAMSSGDQDVQDGRYTTHLTGVGDLYLWVI